jgi:hypothetical protein
MPGLKIGRRCQNCVTTYKPASGILVAISHQLKTSGLLPLNRAFLALFYGVFGFHRDQFAFSLIFLVFHLRLVGILQPKKTSGLCPNIFSELSPTDSFKKSTGNDFEFSA